MSVIEFDDSAVQVDAAIIAKGSSPWQPCAALVVVLTADA
jgi:hypothetical protein